MKNIKIYYNGLRIEGSKELIKLYYTLSSDGNSVSFYACNYDHIPRDYAFCVRNDSDSMTDYFESDHGNITSEHPLFRFFKYAALKASNQNHKRVLKSSHYNEQQKQESREAIAEFEKIANPGQPSAEDLKKLDQFIEAIKTAAEMKRKLEEENRMAERMIEQLETEITIKRWTEEYPLVEGCAKVTIPYSERLGIEDNSVWSLKAADNIFRELDQREYTKHAGYDKTDFVIEWGDFETDGIRWQGRYDIGDGEGGLLKHIFNFVEWNRTHESFGHLRENPPETTAEMELYKRIEQLYNA